MGWRRAGKTEDGQAPSRAAPSMEQQDQVAPAEMVEAGVGPQRLLMDPRLDHPGNVIQRAALLQAGQRTLGNQALRRLLQARLTVNPPDDAYEREADRVAEAVMSMPERQVQRRPGETLRSHPEVLPITPLLQRQEEEEEELQAVVQRQEEEEEELQAQAVVQRQEEEEEEPIQATLLVQRQMEAEEEEEEPAQAKGEVRRTPEVAPGLERRIHGLQGGGRPLPESERAFFEPRFGRDLGEVRIHTGKHAAEMAQELKAHAFTVGPNVVFGAGGYAPETAAGRRLLAHELTHVVQQLSPERVSRACGANFERRARREGPGFKYGGGGSRSFCETQLREAIRRFNDDGRRDLARATELFLSLMPLEGYISAVNTWDSQVITWGTGFAAGGMLPVLYRHLHPSVKSYLAGASPRHFSGGIHASEALRTDTHALWALVHASERDPYREHVLRAQLRTFLTQTAGVTAGGVVPSVVSSVEVPVNTLALHLSHWLPSFFQYPQDMETAMRLAGPGVAAEADAGKKASVRVAAVLRVFAHNMLHRGWGRRDRRRSLVILGDSYLRFDPMARFRLNLRAIFGTVNLSPQATAIVPAFTSGSWRYFQSTPMARMPDNRLVMVQRGRRASIWYDFGEPL